MPEPIEEKSWGDMMEEADSSVRAPVEAIEDNIKKIVELAVNEEGKQIKVTRFYRLETHKVSKAIAKRKTWKKFGLATRDNPHGPDKSTTYVGDEVDIVFTTNKEELDEDKDDPLSKLNKTGGTFKCRMCKGDHWTLQCPYKDHYKPLLELQEKEKAQQNASEPPPMTGDIAAKQGSKYVPPSLRGGAGTEERRGETMNSRRQGDEAATLRVTNLSEDANDSDLKELFNPFGHIARIYLAKDKNTNSSKGFAFVSYYKREDAARAIKALHGFGYDHLILNVEWAKPPSN